MSEAEAAPAAASGAADAVLRSIGLDLSAAADGKVCLNGRDVRVSDTSPKVVSVLDAIAAVCKGNAGATKKAWFDLKAKFPEVCP